ncbi:MAG: hypothetical protein FWB74_04790 [Defluviitaleaceae bacterium]|nr:hypothetical protein [Defluviitaleaceae bacterium]
MKDYLDFVKKAKKPVRGNPFLDRLKNGFSVTVNYEDGSSVTTRYKDMDEFREKNKDSMVVKDEEMAEV